jgi:integrase
MAYDIECWFDRLRQQTGSSVALADDVDSVFQEPKSVSKPTDPHAEISFEPVTRQVMTVSKVCDLYLNDPTSSRTEKSAMTYRTTFATISAILGPETPLKSINREVCRELLEVLRSLPTNAKKRWPQLSPREVAAMANAQGIQPMSLANVNEYMNKLSTLFNWAVKEEIVIRNPAKGLKIANDMAPRDKRKPFSTQQLGRIFNAPLYRGCVDDESRYARQGAAKPRRSRFWIPLIALFSGMRLNEICQMDTADVQEIEGTLCFSVSAKGSGDKHLKTIASDRIVPIHPTLQEQGFAAYVSECRRSGHLKLWPELEPDAFGLYSGRFSRWFARFLETCGAYEDRTCFHSFRHNFRDALRDGDIRNDVALVLGGWTANSNAVADNYGNGFKIRNLYDSIALIRYPDIDLEHLKQIDEPH